MHEFDGLLREALLVTAILSIPVLFLATAIGTGIAILQAATQVQEQTLTLLPKIIAVGVAIVVFGRFGMELCAGLFMQVIVHMSAIATGG